MCGNVGVIDKSVTAQENTRLCQYFEDALFADTLRGKDSTGILLVDDKTMKTIVIKKAIEASPFLKIPKVTTAINASNNVLMCGHNRAATKGAVNDKGAHPFTYGPITMFHNGTLYSWDELSDKVSFDIDSEAIAYSLNKNGTKDTLEKLDGAYALVWYNKKEQTVNFARNKERPLFLASIEGSESMIYASEKSMLTWIAERNNLKLEKVEKLEAGLHTKIFLDDMTVETEEFTIKPSFDWEGYHGQYHHSQTPYYSARNYGSNYGSKYLPKTYEHTQDEHPKWGHLKGKIFQVIWDEFRNIGDKTNKYGKLIGRIHTTKEDDAEFVQVLCYGIEHSTASRYINSNELGVVRIINTSKTDITCMIITDTSKITQIDVLKKRPDIDVTSEKELKKEGYTAEELSSVSGDYIAGPNSRYIEYSEWLKKTKHGCASCSKDFEEDDAEYIVWMYDDSPVCDDCAKELVDAEDYEAAFGSCKLD